ncbi:MAG: hypothetical protein ACTS47_00035 [Candidatus Hodgkinia cicadicola]
MIKMMFGERHANRNGFNEVVKVNLRPQIEQTLNINFASQFERNLNELMNLVERHVKLRS